MSRLGRRARPPAAGCWRRAPLRRRGREPEHTRQAARPRSLSQTTPAADATSKRPRRLCVRVVGGPRRAKPSSARSSDAASAGHRATSERNRPRPAAAARSGQGRPCSSHARPPRERPIRPARLGGGGDVVRAAASMPPWRRRGHGSRRPGSPGRSGRLLSHDGVVLFGAACAVADEQAPSGGGFAGIKRSPPNAGRRDSIVSAAGPAGGWWYRRVVMSGSVVGQAGVTSL